MLKIKRLLKVISLSRNHKDTHEDDNFIDFLAIIYNEYQKLGPIKIPYSIKNLYTREDFYNFVRYRQWFAFQVMQMNRERYSNIHRYIEIRSLRKAAPQRKVINKKVNKI